MQYKCPKCAAVSDQPGNCSACNVPMVEVAAVASVVAPEQPAEATPSPAQPEAVQ